MSDNLLGYLDRSSARPTMIDAAVHQQYVTYPVDQALSS